MNEQIPTPSRLPIVGNALSVGRDPFEFFETARAEYGPVFRVSIPGLSFVCYADADLVERVLVTERDRYDKDPRERELFGDLLGDGLLTARGETWERGRRHVQPAFHPGRLDEYADGMVAAAARVVDGWADGERVDVHEAATEITLSIVASTMFGLDRVDDADVVARAADAITSRFEPARIPLEVPLWVPTPANRRYRRAVRELDDVVERILEQRRHGDGVGMMEMDGADLCSTLQAAAAAGHLTEREVRDHLVTMLLAGHETTAVALTYALGLLATHPVERARVLEEVRAPERIDSSTALPHTDLVVREALRLHPPTYMLFRKTATADTVAGYELPAGTRIVLSQWAVHRDERYYEDPLAFRPDRWRGGSDDRPDFAYFPFGGGPRACIGRRFALLELRLALATILRAVDVEPTPDTDLSPTPALTSRPDGPVWVRVRRSG